MVRRQTLQVSVKTRERGKLMEDCFDMSCYETIARLHLYIDRELSAEEVTIVQAHLTSCPSCECRFHFDEGVKRLIHERCTIVRAPAHLREAVLRLARMPVGKVATIDPELELEIRADLEEDC
jgi:mycothiol system anti-sigma-R factor